MRPIQIEHDPDEARLSELGVREWPIWSKEASEFPWRYDQDETCYLLEGEVIVTPDGGQPVRLGRRDLVILPKGLSCVWRVLKPMKKHYTFG